ncbi:chromosome transmission fidelity protein 18 homolog [Watersipora subatra]|uniref:chromosome transmission fidelity protein 18 homolog n=1 Tax=Watersipora subatra TaxID=2589382 RepID=UPI00355B1D03
MEEDYFEQEFEDELEALNDMESEENIGSHSEAKRSLFTKSASVGCGKLDDSFPQEFSQSPCQEKRRREPSPSSTEATPTSEVKRRRTLLETSSCSTATDDRSPTVVRHRPVLTDQTNSSVTVTPRSLEVVRRKVLRRIPKGEFIAVTAADGMRSGYMVINSDKETAVDGHTGLLASSRHLLPIDIETLRQQVERKRMKTTLDAVDRMTEVCDSVERDLFGESEPTEETKKNMENRSLWVDTYSPKVYIDLMSDEAVNRVLLRWLKMWDYVVFKKEKPRIKKQAAQSKPLGRDGSAGLRKGKLNSKEFFKKKYDDLGLEEEFDKFYRPVQKVVLLCGKPGLGKTTLAHVVARHAGYNVIEMNASDERSAQSFKDKIEDSLTMQPLLGTASPRPNCLIIDEIDGAPAPAINALLSKIITTGSKSEEAKKKKPQECTLMRPIICICNDMFTPALRSLRQHALVLNFPSQCPSLLASRLFEICREEKLKTDMSTLMALCKRSSSDIRSCLNTLQFIRRRKKDLTMKDLMGMSIGAKDEQKNLFAFWQQVFHLPSKTRAQMPYAYDEPVEAADNDSSLPRRVERVAREAQACGEFNRLVQGLHDNFLNMKFKDCFMRNVVTGMNWLTFTDQVNKRIFSQQAFTLYGYLPYLSVIFHLLFAQTAVPKVVYPKTQYEVTSKQKQMCSLLATLVENMVPSVRQHVSDSALSLDILPLLVDVIIQPHMRPVNIQLYSIGEKEVLQETVLIMLAYNLTYSQHKTTEGTYQYTLEPAVDELVQFSDVRRSRKALSYTAKQLIANEVQQEKQRRLDRKSSSLNVESTPSTKHSQTAITPRRRKDSTPTSHTPSRTRARIQDMVTPNHKHKLTPKSLTPSQKEATDFFGRPIDKTVKVLAPEALQAVKDTSLLHTDIWYKFKEGFSNAVRKRLTIQDLL